MVKTIYFSKQDKIFTEDGLLLFVSVLTEKDQDGLEIKVNIDNVYVNIQDKHSIDITAKVLSNLAVKTLLREEVLEIYDEYIVRGVFDDHNEFNGKLAA